MSNTAAMAPNEHTATITRIGIVGAGTMGHGIAYVAATSGFATTLHDIDAEALSRAQNSIETIFEKGIARGKLTVEARRAAEQRLSFATDPAEAFEATELVIEAVPEDLGLKTRVFSEVARYAPSRALFATNTSSLSVTAIAASTDRPTRTLGMHFFNPPYALRLLELVRAEQTDDQTLAAARDVGERLGRELVVVHDAPGFATSRLGLVLGLEAIRMVEAGVATVEDIDRAMKLGYGHPMGPLELTDLVGLDVRLAIAEYLHTELGEQFRPPPLLRRLVRAGKLGKKTGHGFYRWDGG